MSELTRSDDRAHPDDRVIELLALGGLEDDAELTEHVSTCDACAAKLADEARLELALGELHAFRSGNRHIAKPSVVRVHFAPIFIVLAAAALVFFVLRSRPSSPPPELRADPTTVASVAAAPAVATQPADVESVVATLRPALKKCFNPTAATGDAEVVMDVTIAPDGTVADVSFISRRGADDSVAQCLVTVVSGARFQATGRTTHVRLPVRFVVR